MESLYRATLESSGAERQVLLDRANPEIRRAVEAMLLQVDSGVGVLDRPAWELTSGLFESPARLAPGERIGPYRIDAHIGGGGMGEVYRATDERLTRTVAIKISSAQFSNRFEREAKAIAALNHPNICQIYDVGPNYIVMEFIDGLPVVAKGQHPVSVAVALRLATQIASAIEAAHVKGIVHRDLKPANILVSFSGVAKLLDFGLAKQNDKILVPAAGDTTLSITQPGLILGTPAYMSPEQADGRPADVRSDIFSFGTILYEMLSGRRAFSGTSVVSVLASILHRNPEPAGIPPDLSAIVFKCLAKSPNDRFQTATSLLAALEDAAHGVTLRQPDRSKARWRIATAIACGLLLTAGVAVGVYRKAHSAGLVDSVAVIPFSIQSKDAEADYISDGISESINNSLARFSNLKVIPNSVAVNYKGKAANFQQIGRELGVKSILSGRIVQRGDSLSIDIELDDVRSGQQIWGQQYVRQVADLLTVQRDISSEVSRKLVLQLSASDQQKLTSGSTENPEAYQLYLKGEHYTSKFTKEGFDKGIDYLNQAIVLDPNYAAAYSELAYNYINQDDWFIDPKDAAPRARAAAQKALALNETDSQAHVALAIENQWYEWDWAAADREFRRALELDPENADALGYYSWFLPAVGRKDEGIAQARQQLKLNPVSTGANGNYGSVLLFAHHWDEAIEQLRYAIDLNPNYWFDYLFLGRAYEHQSRFPEAIDAFQRGLKMDGNIELWAGLGHAYAASGNKIEAQKVLDHLNEMSAHSYIAPYNVGLIYAGLGEKEVAFDWLNRAYNARSYLLAEYLNTDPRLDGLRSDSRFSDLHRRVGLPAPETP